MPGLLTLTLTSVSVSVCFIGRPRLHRLGGPVDIQEDKIQRHYKFGGADLGVSWRNLELEFSGACERVEVMFLETCVRGWGSGVLRVWESVGSVGGRWCL